MAKASLTDSEFSMWRAVFAFAFVDHSLSLEEQALLRGFLHQVPFSAHQKAILRRDMSAPPDVVTLYRGITDPDDRARFCALARAIVWCDGDMDRQEEIILKRVSCLKDESDSLSRSRDYTAFYHARYKKADMAGLAKMAPRFETRI